MGLDVTSATWEQEVIEESNHRPVLVDFWAEWCGPCRMLGPVLEKLEGDYDGRFRLVKVDTDAEQNLALKYSVSGIPDVKLFYKGQVQDQFTGALPEPAVRRFLEANLPDPALDEIVKLADSDPVAAAEQTFDRQIRQPVAEEILWRAILEILRKQVTAKDVDGLVKFLGELTEFGGPYSDVRASLLGFLERYGAGTEELAKLGELVRGNETAALDFFLERVERSAGDERKSKREDLLTCFFILGNQHPLVNEYRRKLSAVLF